MKNYLALMEKVLSQGDFRVDRTKIGTFALFGETLSFDLTKGFPAVTTKKLFFDSVKAELAGFLEATTRVERMQELGTSIWNANAKNGELGKIYGYQWRKWNGYLDQLQTTVDQIIVNPTSRRHIVTAWNPSELDEMCLPPCHTHFQFFVRKNFLDCIFYMRSVDIFLGMPFDIASYALLTHIVAQDTGLTPGKLTGMFADCHLYANHLEQAKIQLTRPPYPAPILHLDKNASINNFSPKMAFLLGYISYDKIIAPMAV